MLDHFDRWWDYNGVPMAAVMAVAAFGVLATGVVVCFFNIECGLWLLLMGGGIAGFASVLVERRKRRRLDKK
jgi:hypothetical protein